MTVSPIPSATFERLDVLTTEQLREQAFALAEHRHDIGFFWAVIKHLPESGAIAAEDGSPGNLIGSLIETVQAARELFGGHLDELGDAEPLLRAKFIDYLASEDSEGSEDSAVKPVEGEAAG
jgi:hypothetical protein